MTFFLLREAHTKREGTIKLLAAFVLAPIVASLLWAVPCMAFAPFFLADTPGYIEGEYYAFDIYRDIAKNNCRIAFLLGTPAFVLMLLCFKRFKLHNLANLCAFAALFPTVGVLLWVLYDLVVKSASQVAISELLKVMVLILLLLGVPSALVAMSVALLFWHVGIKNNHWLLNR